MGPYEVHVIIEKRPLLVGLLQLQFKILKHINKEASIADESSAYSEEHLYFSSSMTYLNFSQIVSLLKPTLFVRHHLYSKAMQKDFIYAFWDNEIIRLSNSNLIRKKFNSVVFAKILKNRFENKCENKCTKIITKIFKFTC